MDNEERIFKCCGKEFGTLHGLKIHQGKICKKKDTQQRRSNDHQTCSQNPQDTHHRGEQPTVELGEIRKEYQTKNKGKLAKG